MIVNPGIANKINLPRRYIHAVAKICNRICPASILANNRTPSEIGLKIKDKNSTQINKGNSQRGMLRGQKTLTNFIPNSLYLI